MMRRAGVLVVSVVLALLSGCEPGDGEPAADPTTTTTSVGTHASVLELVEVADAAAKRRRTAAFQTGYGPQHVGKGRFAYREEGFAMAIRSLRNGQQAELRAVGDTIFVRAIGQLAVVAGGKPWVAMVRPPQYPLASLLGQRVVTASRHIDPTRTFDVIIAAGRIESSTRDTIGGAEVTRYDIELGVRRLADHIEYSSREEAQQRQAEALRAAADKGVTTMAAQIWLGRDNLPRRVSLADVSALPENGDGADELPRITVTYRDWGRARGVGAPPAHQVGTAQPPG